MPYDNSSEVVVIRASSLSGYADCPRRSAARMFRREIIAAGFDLRETPPGIGAATREEVQRLADAAPAHLSPLIVFLAHTGLRMGEALSLDWGQVNLKARHLILLHTKNGTQRGVPLNEVALAALANLPHRNGRVFRTHLGEPYQLKFTGQIKKGWKAACEKAGFVEVALRRGRDGSMRRVFHNSITPHTLRHTFISWMVQAGVPLYTAGKVAGHKSSQMTARYAHLSPDHMMDAVTSIVQNPCRGRITGANPLKLKRG